tara:strand:- start:74 stop:553 length:480 start_codon:yes stop_codon:yes gene_type:complete
MNIRAINTLQAKAIQKDIREGLDTMRKAWAREMRGRCRVCVGLAEIRMSNDFEGHIDASNEKIVPTRSVPTLAQIKEAASLIGTIDQYTGLRIDGVGYSARLDFIYWTGQIGCDERVPSDVYMDVSFGKNLAHFGPRIPVFVDVDIDLPQGPRHLYRRV